MHRLDTPETDAHASLRKRLSGLGILAWRLSAGGHVMHAPRLAGAQAAWVCSSDLIARLESHTAQRVESGRASRFTLLPGCEVILTPLRHRRRVVEWTASMFLTTELFESEPFLDSCRQSRVDPAAARRTLRPLANFTPAEIDRFESLLPQIAADLETLTRNDSALGGFSITLAEAYEHIELTHNLAGAMRDVAEPHRFFDEAVRSLSKTLPFGWVAIRLDHAPWLETPERGLHANAGECPLHDKGIDALLDALPDDTPEMTSAILSGEPVDSLIGPDEQVVVFPIRRDRGRQGVLLAGSKGGDDPQVSSYDTRLIDAVGAFATSYYDIVCLVNEQQATFMGSMRAISAALDAKDHYTRGHSERVAHLASALARAIGLPEHDIERIHIAGLMHDVGKIGVPEAVLCKPGRLTDEEFDAIKRHPRIGHEILSGIPQLADILPGVLWHHERWDGRGYPDGLKAESIPLMGRLLAIADTFDAMSSDRSYRPKMPRETVLAEILKCGGSQFDPDLVRPFAELDFSEFDRMVAEHAPQRIVEDDRRHAA
jgi:HD-GYP domain-containing protein (c-di-GMP phosphodiesterase class II)